MNRALLASRSAVDDDPAAIQHIELPSEWERFEGIDFSASGDLMAIASSGNHCVLLYRREPSGRFGDKPCGFLFKESHKLVFPHDVAFSTYGGVDLLAVAQRTRSVVIYERKDSSEGYGPERAFEFISPDSCDGLAFIPPGLEVLAVCSGQQNSVLFFRRESGSPARFEREPEFELRHQSISNPDGIGFSNCGRWLAVANHNNHCISIFKRRKRILTGGRLRYGPNPVAVIKGPQLRHPHSVAFTESNHIVVTNAGDRHFNVYEPSGALIGPRWLSIPVSQVIVTDEEVFKKVNAENPREGGPKGVAICGNDLAVCGPEFGIKIFSLREG